MTSTAARGFSLRSLISHILKRRRDARSVRTLNELPDSVLADIGLTRFDVQAAMHASWRDTPSACLERAAIGNRALQEAANDRMRRSIGRQDALLAA